MTRGVLILSRFSFHQLLLAGFLLIAALLSGTSVHALLTLEHLAAHSRESAREAVLLTENAQRLAERTVAMERSARQFLVLDDPAFRQRFAEAWQDARDALSALSAALPDASRDDFAEWNQESEAAWAVLEAPKSRRVTGQQALDHAFARLPAINDRLALESKRDTEHRNNALVAELEQQRNTLTVLVAGAVALAALLAFGFGVWLSRPLRRIETAISLLGENHFEHPIEVNGPSDLRRLGEQLDWLRQRLANLENDKARFLRHVSHELKTPLAALCEGVALLQEEVVGELSEPQHEITRILQQNTAALQTQIEDLLRYNAATFDAQRLQRAALDIRGLLQQAVESQRLQWQARALRVEVDGAAGPIRADADKLLVVLGNLLSNALRFSPDGGLIRFTVAEEQGRVRIDCVDQGPGIAPADMARVFEPFYQGERQPPGARRGSGIGLSIVREYVEAHGGTVQLLPHDGGAHFRIELAHDT